VARSGAGYKCDLPGEAVALTPKRHGVVHVRVAKLGVLSSAIQGAERAHASMLAGMLEDTFATGAFGDAAGGLGGQMFRPARCYQAAKRRVTKKPAGATDSFNDATQWYFHARFARRLTEERARLVASCAQLVATRLQKGAMLAKAKS
jgi:hypothetical protein